VHDFTCRCLCIQLCVEETLKLILIIIFLANTILRRTHGFKKPLKFKDHSHTKYYISFHIALGENV
jgi:hypothetical protein